MKMLFYFLLLFTMIECNQDKKSSNANKAILKLIEKEFDFGEISRTDTINHRFEFSNTGEIPLIIKNVSTSCGCTVPRWHKESILSTKKGFIEIEYVPNSIGQINKSIVVETNTDSSFTVVYLKGVVKEVK